MLCTLQINEATVELESLISRHPTHNIPPITHLPTHYPSGKAVYEQFVEGK